MTTFIFGSFRINYHTNLVKKYRNVYLQLLSSLDVYRSCVEITMGHDTRQRHDVWRHDQANQGSDFILQYILGLPVKSSQHYHSHGLGAATHLDRAKGALKEE